MITRSAVRAGARSTAYGRIALWVALAVSEMLVVSVLYDFAFDVEHFNPVFYVTRLARWVAIGAPLFILLTWTERRRLADSWKAVETNSFLDWPLAVNLLVFAAMVTGSLAFNSQSAASPTPSWPVLLLLGSLLAATALTLVRIVVPLRGLASLLWQWRGAATFAALAALVIVILADATTHLWGSMADGTLLLSAAILKLYETNVIVDTAERGLGVGNFGVQIWDSCSGFEGLALVAGFVTVYLWVFRQQLSFPKALVLYPIGLAASWVLNSVRIALLVSLGAHVSPTMAVKGFHSQAGWIAFLAIALGVMALSSRLGLVTSSKQPVAASATSAEPIAPTRYDATVGYLMPFVALMLGAIAMSAAVPHDRPLYALKAGLVVIALWLFRRRLGSWRVAIPGLSVTAGLLVGVAWIATSPPTDASTDLGPWLLEIGPMPAVLWLVVRGIGSIVLVPIAEELAFRGYLYRRLISRDFHLVQWTTFSWVALVVSSIAFGVLHDRLIAGTLAGVVFGLLMLRGGRLGDAIVAHAIANALIFGWALAFQEWSLL